MNPAKQINGTMTVRELILQTVIKQGAWAVLVFSILCFLGYELDELRKTAGASMVSMSTSLTTMSASIDKTLKLMEDAQRMMAPVAAKREEECALLREISAKLSQSPRVAGGE